MDLKFFLTNIYVLPEFLEPYQLKKKPSTSFWDTWRHLGGEHFWNWDNIPTVFFWLYMLIGYISDWHWFRSKPLRSICAHSQTSFGRLGPIFGSKMGQNGLKCHLWGPDGPKWLEQGGTRLEHGTGYKDWPFWSLYHSINTQIWPLGGLKMGQNVSIWLLLGLNGLWCPKMVGTRWNKVGKG